MFFSGPRATILRIHPNGAMTVWWNGKLREDVLSFDAAGYKIIFQSLGGSIGIPEDVVRNNIKLFLNDALQHANHNFDQDGSIVLTEAMVKKLLRID